MRTRVKFCGITRREDALFAAGHGVDALGLIFADASRRRVQRDAAAGIANGLPPFVTRVGLFMDTPADAIRATLDRVPLDWLQFHGTEDAAFCRGFGRPYLRVVPMGDVDDVAAFAARFPDAGGFVLDAHRSGEAGGTGRAFDWSRLDAVSAGSLVLAGGLRPENVADAIRRVRPWAVDVSSGIESTPGIKDRARMQAFLDEVQRADRELHAI
jgi:phosphoribosylanthranilate isomerase